MSGVTTTTQDTCRIMASTGQQLCTMLVLIMSAVIVISNNELIFKSFTGKRIGGVEGKLVLLSESSRQPVGLGTVCRVQDTIHGHAIPHGFVKVMIEYIKPGIKPPFSLPFDDEVIQCGQFALWPKHCTSSAIYS